MKRNYQTTMRACFTGYIVQAIVNNFLPLLFLTLQQEYAIPLTKITLLITINFVLQLGIDLASAVFIDRIGYRAAAVAAHVFAAAGLVLLTVLPGLLPDAFAGLLIAVMVYAVGGGLLEVLVSPIVEACPTPNKEKAMSMLHSFYCWGSVGVIGLSTLFFAVFGIENWRILAVIWAVIPAANAIVFTRVPIAKLTEDGEKGLSIAALFKNKMFLLMCLLMLCAGASGRRRLPNRALASAKRSAIWPGRCSLPCSWAFRACFTASSAKKYGLKRLCSQAACCAWLRTF